MSERHPPGRKVIRFRFNKIDSIHRLVLIDEASSKLKIELNCDLFDKFP